MNEDYDKYTADASKQSNFEAIKKLLEGRWAAKDNTDKLENETKIIYWGIVYIIK